jgi:hypothetical protein
MISPNPVSAQMQLNKNLSDSIQAMNASQQQADNKIAISNFQSDTVSALTSRITKIGADIKQAAAGN